MLLGALGELLFVLGKVIYLTAVGLFKAMLPVAWLPKKSIRGQTVLITGSGSGIGRLMAIKFAKLGARLVLWDINEAMNLETKAMVDVLSGIEASAYQVDISDRKQIYAMAERVREEVGDPHILVNNAGIGNGMKLLECPDALIEKTMAINCNALFYCTKAFLPAMIANRRGHVVNISSLAGLFGVSGLADYCASKHGAVGFSAALRLEMADMGMPITVTTVCPYFIRTPLIDGMQMQRPLVFPIMEPDYVVEQIVAAVLTDTEELLLPWASNILVALKSLLPGKVMYVLADYLGFFTRITPPPAQKTTTQQQQKNGKIC